MSRNAEMKEAAGITGKVLQGEYRNMSFFYTTLFNQVEILPCVFANYGLDVWVENQGKVLSIWWDPLEVVKFKRGDWIDKILDI